MSVVAIIPARYASTRFPGKPLALLSGKPMIQWVVERVQQVSEVDAVIVATDNEEIFHVVEAFGGEVRMTGEHHVSGTDRVWEVASKMPGASLVFNIQGDEPLLEPRYLEEAIGFLKSHHEHADIVTLKTPIRELRELEDPNIVKVVTAESEKAIYFSRAPIPCNRDARTEDERLQHCFRHIGIYGFQKSALERYVQLPVSHLEQLEKLEQLRALEAGMSIYALSVPEAPLGVDTPEDLAHIQSILNQQSVA